MDNILPLVLEALKIQELGIVPITVLWVVFVFFFGFILLYFIPALVVGLRLRSISGGLEKLKERVTDISVPGGLFDRRGSLQHIWSEYAETLHSQYELSDGERKLVAIRSTVPAEVFFSNHAVVDTPISSEFFKHLPGILTGVGIIGTFLELIWGVSNFATELADSLNQTSAAINAMNLNEAISKLLNSVVGAFVASAAAIVVAMVVTFIEKLLLTRCYYNLGRLVRSIDGLFDAGAGEEYLSELVKSASESATQTKHLKDSLVGDLKTILTDLTEKQIAAQAQMGKSLAGEIGEQIKNTLNPTLDRISGDQGQAVQKMTQDLLSSFMAKLEEVMGSQLNDIGLMVKNSADSMREMQEQFKGLIDKLSQAGDDAGKGMAETLERMMSDAERRQREMVERMEATMKAMQDNIAAGASDVSEELAKSVDGLKDSMQALLDKVAQSSEVVAETGTKSVKAQEEAAKGMLENMQQTANNATSSYSEIMEKFSKITTDAIESMDKSAATISTAAERFTEAGHSVSGALEKGNELFGDFTRASGELNTAATTIRELVGSYDSARENLQQMVAALQGVADDVDTRVGVSDKIVSDMQTVSDQFSKSVAEIEGYSENINQVIQTGFNSFAAAVNEGMVKHRGEFDSALSQSVMQFNNTLEELDGIMEELGSRIENSLKTDQS